VCLLNIPSADVVRFFSKLFINRVKFFQRVLISVCFFGSKKKSLWCSELCDMFAFFMITFLKVGCLSRLCKGMFTVGRRVHFLSRFFSTFIASFLPSYSHSIGLFLFIANIFNKNPVSNPYK